MRKAPIQTSNKNHVYLSIAFSVIQYGIPSWS